MSFRLDHIVVAVGDLAQTAADYRALGFTVLIGGKHPGRTSHNALVVFEDGAYLELIAWQQPDPDHRWYNVHARHGDGLMDFALLPEDAGRAIAGAKERGLALNGPIAGGRVQPDGCELKWQVARPTTFDLPFLCGDLTPRALRVPEGVARRHRNGVQGVASVAIAVKDLEVSIARYRALLGIVRGDEAGSAAAMGLPVVLPGIGLRIAAVTLGATALVLMTPAGVAAPGDEPAAARELRERLATRGEGPCALTLRTATELEGRTLERDLAHGVAIDTGYWPVPNLAREARPN